MAKMCLLAVFLFCCSCDITVRELLDNKCHSRVMRMSASGSAACTHSDQVMKMGEPDQSGSVTVVCVCQKDGGGE